MASEAESIARRYSSIRASRDGYWKNLWDEVRHYVMPDQKSDVPEGSQATRHIFDATAIQARERLASGMYTWMAPGDRRWFRLAPSDRRLSGNPNVESWFRKATETLSELLADSNFPGELVKALNDLACGIDAVLYCEEDIGRGGIVFRSYPIESVCYQTDSRDRVDTVFREFELTSRQCLEYFSLPDDSLPSEVREDAGSDDRCDRRRCILHAVFPRRVKDNSVGAGRMAFKSVFVDLKTKTAIREGGYEELPYAVCRFRKSTREQYGRGPGIDALPDIRMLNRMREAFVRNCDFSADPSWMIPEGSLVSRNFNRAPGGVIFYRPGLSGARPEPVPRGNNPQLDAELIEQERSRIRDMFFWDVFDPLGDLRNMTAQEATIRNESKLIPFGPIACNIHNDLLQPMLERVFGILARSGRLDAVPLELQDGGYKVEFMSRIALSMKRQSAMGWLQTESTLQGLAAVRPDLMDNFDTDRIVRDVAESNGCEASWLRKSDERDRIRADRRKAEQEQQEQEQAAAVMSSAGQLGKRPEAGSPMQGIMGALAGQAGQEAVQ